VHLIRTARDLRDFGPFSLCRDGSQLVPATLSASSEPQPTLATFASSWSGRPTTFASPPSDCEYFQVRFHHGTAYLKITIFGLTISSSWGNGHATPYRAIIRGLKRLSHDVSFYEKDVEYYYWRRDFGSSDYCDLILYPSWSEVRQRALKEAAESDVVVVGSYCPDGARIADELFALPNPLHVFYDLDTPITLSSLRSGDLEYLRADQMPLFDLYLSFTGGQILRDLGEEYGVRNAQALYGCVDPEVHARVPAQEKYCCDLSYMGTYAADRQHKVDELFAVPARATPSASFVLAGSLYPKTWFWPANVRKFDHVRPGDHPALYSSSRATLNITRDGMAQRGFCPSGRFFEAAACGTPILTDWFEGLDSFFCPAEELVVVKSAQDVIAALQMSCAELSSIARRARERTLSEHTGDARARQLVHYLHVARGSVAEAAQGPASPKQSFGSSEKTASVREQTASVRHNNTEVGSLEATT
jgi:spore maturation protein CgeB